ncbi:MAG TPA: GspH/FimT family pseudopilin [Allosphingosinicella sp.]|nr:GspH/FimT family pseudopilin [Allosphingosinicella sp.]
MRDRAQDSGFTLVELMVVIVIIGLAAAAVVLTIPDRGAGLNREAERFAARAKAAHDIAIVESRAATVAIGPGGYDVVRRGGSAHYDWDEATEVDLSGGRDGGLRFDPTGLADPARVVLRQGERHVTIDVGGDGRVQVQR